jgi:hypothetical protein
MAVGVNTSSDAAVSFTAANAPTVTFAGAVAAGSCLILGIRLADETTTIDSVADSVNGAWTLVDGPDDHASTTLRSYVYKFENSGAGTPVVTVTFAAAATPSGHLGVVEVTGTGVVVDAVGTTRVTSTSSDTTHTSNSVTATAAGATLACLLTSTTTSFVPGGGASLATSQQETRVNWAVLAHGSSGSYSQSVDTTAADLTTPEGTHSTHAIIALKETTPAGRTTKNTRPFPLGVGLGLNRGVSL